MVYKGFMQKKSEVCENAGFGAVLYPNGDFFVGCCKENASNGKGLFMHKNEFYCIGNFVNNRLQGDGVIRTIGISRYEGQVEDGVKHGKGKEVFDDHSRYEGDYVKDKKSGQGKFVFPEGSIYEGSFENDHICGYGVYEWPDEKHYEGSWKRGLMHTKGNDKSTFTWADKRKYTGQYKFDKKEGNGLFTFANGMKYDGEWHNGKQHGAGSLIKYNQDGTTSGIKEGYWVDGKQILGTITNSHYSRQSQPLEELEDLHLLWRTGNEVNCGGSHFHTSKQAIMHNGWQYPAKTFFDEERWDLGQHQWIGKINLSDNCFECSKNESYQKEISVKFSNDWQLITSVFTTIIKKDNSTSNTNEDGTKTQEGYVFWNVTNTAKTFVK